MFSGRSVIWFLDTNSISSLIPNNIHNIQSQNDIRDGPQISDYLGDAT
jgi:hypothetical protein